MKKLYIILFFVIFCFGISFSASAMQEMTSTLLCHKYSGKNYIIDLGYDFYYKESIFEKYEADITYQKQTYSILYISIEMNPLYSKDIYLVETFMRTYKRV